MKPRHTVLLMRGVSLAAIFAPLAWIAWAYTPAPLVGALGIAAALVSIRIGQAGEARYGRRVPVTEMLGLGRRGDRQMLLGGLAGYLMIVLFALAAWLAWRY
ncbi:hypothetical protein [Azonexus fungiphilus]|uniref:hypothetical protein n=1 Tax=Azonexus fungiphilus TaxID=146940 RepID=UPI00156B9B20|nr:hypothetical protein [Azonexus fungiphilus]NHC05608.1 hypothetical protein [Azonexus fungiphilus]